MRPSQEGKVAAKCLHEKHNVKTVLLTLGEHGALLSTEGGAKQDVIPAAKVEAKDTSGAGDAFLGAFAFYLARFPDMAWAEMARRACVIATATVALPGTQSSYPSRDALPEDLF
jgi:ribokinase